MMPPKNTKKELFFAGLGDVAKKKKGLFWVFQQAAALTPLTYASFPLEASSSAQLYDGVRSSPIALGFGTVPHRCMLGAD